MLYFNKQNELNAALFEIVSYDSNNESNHDDLSSSSLYEQIEQLLKRDPSIVHTVYKDHRNHPKDDGDDDDDDDHKITLTPLHYVLSNPYWYDHDLTYRIVKLMIEASQQAAMVPFLLRLMEKEQAPKPPLVLQQRNMGLSGALPIHLACRNVNQMNIDAIEYMIECYPACIYMTDTHQGNLPIHDVCVSASNRLCYYVSLLPLLKRLLELWPDSLLTRNVQGNLPLHLAMHASAPLPDFVVSREEQRQQQDYQLEIVQYLVEANPDTLYIPNKSGVTPVQIACMAAGLPPSSTSLWTPNVNKSSFYHEKSSTYASHKPIYDYIIECSRNHPPPYDFYNIKWNETRKKSKNVDDDEDETEGDHTTTTTPLDEFQDDTETGDDAFDEPEVVQEDNGDDNKDNNDDDDDEDLEDVRDVENEDGPRKKGAMAKFRKSVKLVTNINPIMHMANSNPMSAIASTASKVQPLKTVSSIATTGSNFGKGLAKTGIQTAFVPVNFIKKGIQSIGDGDDDRPIGRRMTTIGMNTMSTMGRTASMPLNFVKNGLVGKDSDDDNDDGDDDGPRTRRLTTSVASLKNITSSATKSASMRVRFMK